MQPSMRARHIFKTNSAPASVDAVGGEGWAPLLFGCPLTRCHKARIRLSPGQHVRQTDLAEPLWCTPYHGARRKDRAWFSRVWSRSKAASCLPALLPGCLRAGLLARCPPRLPARAQIAGSLAEARRPSHALCGAEYAVSMQRITAVTGCQ